MMLEQELSILVSIGTLLMFVLIILLIVLIFKIPSNQEIRINTLKDVRRIKEQIEQDEDNAKF